MAENSGSQPPKPPLVEIKGDWQIKSPGDNVLDVGPNPKDTERIPLPPIEDAGVRAGTVENVGSTIPLPPVESVRAQPVSEASVRTGGSTPPTVPTADIINLNSIKPPGFSKVQEVLEEYSRELPEKTKTNLKSKNNR